MGTNEQTLISRINTDSIRENPWNPSARFGRRDSCVFLLQWWNFAHKSARIWSAVTCHRFCRFATCRQSRAASSGPGELDAFPHSTATSRLPKARTSPRTPKCLRLRRAGSIRGYEELGGNQVARAQVKIVTRSSFS